MKVYQFENVEVTLIDTSSNNERKKKLEKPLQDFFKQVLKEKESKENEKETFKKINSKCINRCNAI